MRFRFLLAYPIFGAYHALIFFREVLIKSGMQITQTDFSSDCTKVTQEYLMYFKEFSCNKTENMQVRCVPRFIQRFLRYNPFSFASTVIV